MTIIPDSTNRRYPLPRAADDPRFTFGLVLDVGRVLVDHGFPPIDQGDDHAALSRALFGFLYAPAGGDPAAVAAGEAAREAAANGASAREARAVFEAAMAKAEAPEVSR